MRVLLLNCSPHEQGCTFTALEEVARALNEDHIQSIIAWAGMRQVRACNLCGFCSNQDEPRCMYQDALNDILGVIDSCDALVIGSPVHYAAASGIATAFCDRLFRIAAPKLAYKPAAAVVSARRAGTTAALDQLNKYFTINNMPVVSSAYWNMVHGNTPEEVRQDAEGMQIMRTLGHNMAWLLKCIEAGKQAGIDHPVREEKIKTNYIR